VLRPNGHRRKVRTGHCLPLPHCAIRTKKAWGGTGYVSSLPDGTAGPLFSGREIQSGGKALCGRCGTRASSLLDAISSRPTLYESSPTRIRARIGQRSRWHASYVDKAEEKAGVYRDITRRSLAATGTTGRTAVRVRRTGTTLPRTRTTTSGCGAPVTHDFRSAVTKVRQAVHFNMWSAGQILLRGIHVGVWQSVEYQGRERRGQH